MGVMRMDTAFPFEVDAESDVPLWVQLRQRIIHLINSGHFKPGDRLPTVRGLASEISINYNTVNKAYVSLVSDGYLESARGRGVFVRGLDTEVGEEHAREIDGILDDCVAACRDLGLTLDDVQKCMVRKIAQMKRAEHGTDAASSDGEDIGGANAGRIVRVDVGADADRGACGA